MKIFFLKTVKVIDFTTVWTGRLFSLLIIPLILIILFEIVARYFFNSPTNWAMEVSTMVFGVYMIWSCGPSLLGKVQVVMDAFYNKWKPRSKAIMDSLTYLFAFVFCLAVFHQATVYAVQSWQIAEHSQSILGQPLYHWKTIIAAGTFMLLIQSISQFIKNIWFAITGEELV